MRFYNALLFALFILILPNVYAATFDNVKSYTEPTPTEKYGSIEIKNFYGIGDTLAKYTLTDNSDYCLIDCYAEGTAQLNIDAPLFDNFKFEPISGLQQDVAYKVYLVKTETIINTYPDYKEQCSIQFNVTSGKNENVCQWVKNGNKTTSYDRDYKTLYQNEILPTGNYRWRIEGKKGKSQTVDWIAQLDNDYLGKMDFTEWTLWESNYPFYRQINVSFNSSLQNFTYLVNATGFTLGNGTNQIVWVKADNINDTNFIYYKDDFNYTFTNGTKDTGLCYDVDWGNVSHTDTCTWRNYALVYHFSEGTGNIAKDSSSFSNNGSISAPTYVTGVYGLATNLSWGTSYVDIATLPNAGTTSSTIVMRTKIGNYGIVATMGGSLYSQGQEGVSSFDINLWDGQDKLRIQPTGPSSSKLNKNQWYHIVITCDQTTTKIYIDGYLNATGANSGSCLEDFTGGSNNCARISRGCGNNGQYGNATVDEFRILNYSWSGAEVLRDYQQGLTANSQMGNQINSADATAPVSILTSPANNTASTLHTQGFVCNATDETALSNISLYLGVGTLTKNETNQTSGLINGTKFQVSGMADGAYTWNCLATDANNNKAFNTTNYTLSIDSTIPSSVILNAPIDGSKQKYNINNISFNISAVDVVDTNLTCNLTIDGVNNKTLGVTSGLTKSSSIAIRSFAQGNHSWNATCGDDLGNTNTSTTFSFEVNIPPNVPTLIPTNASYQNDTSISLNCSSADNNSDSVTYGYYGDINPAAGLDFIANNSYTSTQWNTTNGNGTYLWACNAFDGYDFSSYSANNTIYLSTVVLGTPRENHTNFTLIGDYASFTFNISFNNITIRDINAVFTWEGTNQTITETNISGSNSTLFNASFILPLVSGLTTKKFNWTVYAYYTNGTKKQSTFSYTQEISGVTLFNCSDGNDTTIRVLNISYRLEQSDLTNISGNFRGTFNFWTDSRANNITVSMIINDTKQFYVCITPNGTYNTDAQFQYNSPGYDYRDYYLINEELSNNSRHIELYLLEIALGTGITFTVQDEAENPLVGYYIKAERYDPGTNTYKLVGMGKTSESGNDLIYLRQNDAFYRFIVMNYDNVVLITIPQKVTTSTLILNVVPSTFGEILGDFDNLVYTLTYTNTSTTGTFSLNYDSTGAGTYRNCLKVLRKRFNGDSVICDTCQTAVAGTISCDIDLTLNGNYIATYYSSINPDSYIFSLQEIIEEVNQLKNKLGGEAVFLVAIVIGFVALSMTFSPVIPLVLTLVILVLFAMLGIFNVTYVSIVSIVLMGIVILSRIKD